MKKICFLAPSGFGKSTAINVLKKYYKFKNIKIAEPLYELQEYFYKLIKTKLKGEQDGELLQFFGKKIRKENPNYMLERFKEEVNKQKELDFLTNDDCRPLDYEFVKQMGFIFIEIKGYKRNRQDHTPINTKDSNEWSGLVKCDYELENFGTLEEYEASVLKLIKKILN